MKLKSLSIALLVAAGFFGAVNRVARADQVTVSINGTVEWNELTGPPLNGAHVGDASNLTFTVDSTHFVNDPNFPTRGYPIDISSFKLTFPTFSIGLQNPFPGNITPYFVLRNNDPQVDGFLVSNNTSDFGGLPINQAGQISQLTNEFHVTYGGSTLPSLNILDALGHYDYTGLSVFNWVIDDGPVDALGIDFVDMSISVPEPASAGVLLVGCATLLARRRRSRN